MLTSDNRAALVLAAAGALAFCVLAACVAGGVTQELDESVLRALRNAEDLGLVRGPHWFGNAARDITALGSAAVLVILVCIVVGFLQMRGNHAATLIVAASALTGLGLGLLLKDSVERARPSVVPHLDRVASGSFPSGHSMLSAIVYLTLGALLARFTQKKRLKAFFVITAFALSGLVGTSRVVLGVHYPSDVLAGWFAGTAWASLCWFVAHRLQQRGKAEREAIA